MKENSIEEDIAKINTYIELVLEKNYCDCNELNTILGKHCDGSKNVAYAMQHILSAYKRALKENEELKKIKEISSNITEEDIDRAIKEAEKQYIPVQKVKDKIEEYKNMLKTCNKAKDIDRIKAINERILELQELLEGRK